MIVKSSPGSILPFSLSMLIRNGVFIVSSPEPPHDRCRNLVGWSGRGFRSEFCSTPLKMHSGSDVNGGASDRRLHPVTGNVDRYAAIPGESTNFGLHRIGLPGNYL